jgi:hypothetical protein
MSDPSGSEHHRDDPLRTPLEKHTDPSAVSGHTDPSTISGPTAETVRRASQPTVTPAPGAADGVPSGRATAGALADPTLVAATSMKSATWLSTWFAVFGVVNAPMALMAGYLPAPWNAIIPTAVGAVGVLVLLVWAWRHRLSVLRYRRASAGFWIAWIVIWGLLCAIGYQGVQAAWWVGAIALAGLGYASAVSLRHSAQADLARDFRVQ